MLVLLKTLACSLCERMHYTPGANSHACIAYEPVDKADERPECCTCVTFCPAVCVFVLCALLLLIVTNPWLLCACTLHGTQLPEIIDGFLPRRISFSSCMGNWIDHSLMNKIDSDVHIFLGDSIYGDDYSYEFEDWRPKWLSFIKLPVHLSWYYALLYQKLSCRQSFKSLFHRVPYILSVWDDHDYGCDDETISNPMKQRSKQMFQEFWKLNSQRRNVKGVYGSYQFRQANLSVLVVLPDLHYSTNASRLFDTEQWEWLSSLLLFHRNNTIILGLSTPMSGLWDRYPKEVDDLLAMLDPSRSVVISGDPHVPFLVYFSSGHIDITSSPLAMLGNAPAQIKVCHTNCTVDQNQDNYGLLDLQDKTGVIMSADGPLLKAKIFADVERYSAETN